jgi:hypothetical protein
MVPRHIIGFLNKSEEQRFMRLALRIYNLHLQSKDEVLYTYQRTFKFLSEMLSVEDFQTLTFMNVNMLIDQVFQTKKTPQNDGKERVTLRKFIYNALAMPYKITDRSYTLLNPEIKMDAFVRRKMFPPMTNFDINANYNKKVLEPTQELS